MESNQLLQANKEALESLIDDSDEFSNSFFDIVTKATAIFYESYIRPEIISSGECREVQITLRDKKSRKVPAVANVRLRDSKLYWAIYASESRDALYQELLIARESLEAKTEELEKLTRIDSLTSLLNRRGAKDDLHTLILQAKRNFVPTTFLLIDIDWFKQINDIFGHDRGDEILIELSALLKNTARETDIVARWGGEEFLVTLHDANMQSAHEFCERLHSDVRKIQVGKGKYLSVSIGGFELKRNLVSEDQLFEVCLKNADEALYEAKETGRNKTVFCVK